MPTYAYECKNPDCIGEFEEFHSMSEEAKLKVCPICAKEGRGESNPVERLISGGSGRGIVPLTNAEFVATLPGESRKVYERGARDEKFAASFVGEQKYSRSVDVRDKMRRG